MQRYQRQQRLILESLKYRGTCELQALMWHQIRCWKFFYMGWGTHLKTAGPMFKLENFKCFFFACVLALKKRLHLSCLQKSLNNVFTSSCDVSGALWSITIQAVIKWTQGEVDENKLRRVQRLQISLNWIEKRDKVELEQLMIRGRNPYINK